MVLHIGSFCVDVACEFQFYAKNHDLARGFVWRRLLSLSWSMKLGSDLPCSDTPTASFLVLLLANMPSLIDLLSNRRGGSLMSLDWPAVRYYF